MEAQMDLEFSDREAAGRLVALERFGVRNFEARGSRFYLNGRPIYLFGMNTGNSILNGVQNWSHGPAATGKYGYNWHNCCRRLLRLRKRAGMNSQRIHTGPNIRLAYDLCDEIGLMVRDEWTPADLKPLAEDSADWSVDYIKRKDLGAYFMPDKSDFLPRVRRILKRWVEWNYHNPSVITWSGGNEYGAAEPMTRLYVKLFNQYMHRFDPQKRPVTPASGLHWARGEQELFWKPLPADYIDFHNYDLFRFSWTGMADSYNQEQREIMKMYGSKVMPYMNGECVALAPPDRFQSVAPGNVYDSRGEPLLDRYLGYVTGLYDRRKRHARLAWRMMMELRLFGIRGVRDFKARGRAMGRTYKRVHEITRRDCPGLAGYSIHGFNPHGQTECALNNTPPEAIPVLAPCATAQQPLLTVPDFWTRHVFAGKPFSFNLHIINYRQDGDVVDAQLEVTVRGSNGDVVGKRIPINRVPMGERRIIPITLMIPTGISGVFQFMSCISENGRTATANSHEILIVAEKQLGPIQSTRKIALYESAAVNGRQASATTSDLLARFGVSFTALRDFSQLVGIDVLVIARNSMDGNLARNARKIRDWIEQGGRVLVFEQEQPVKVPFAPALWYSRCGKTPYCDLIRGSHPVFADMGPRYFEAWGADNTTHDVHILPLGKNVLLTAPERAFRWRFEVRHSFNFTTFGMGAVEFRIGKGACLLSQLQVTTKHATDSAAALYAHNLLAYTLAGSWAVDGIPLLAGDTGKVETGTILNPGDVIRVDISAIANRSLHDNNRNHGWFQAGSGADLRKIPRGRCVFLAGVPFRILNRRNAAMVIGHSPARKTPDLPKAIRGVPINARCRAICFLHTAGWVSKCREKGHVVFEYLIRYEDGSSAVFPVRNRIEIADWYMPVNLERATVGWRTSNSRAYGVYVTRWENPHPEKKIASLDIIGKNKALVGVIAITAVKAD